MTQATRDANQRVCQSDWGASRGTGLVETTASPVRPPRPEGGATLALDELSRCLQQPTRHLLAHRLGVRLRDDYEEVADREPLALDGLQRWALGDTLLERSLLGDAVADVERAERGAGRLPSGTPGRCLYDDLAEDVGQLARQAAARREGAPRSVTVDLPLANARLVGQVGGVYPAGLVRHQFARVGARHLLDLWLRHLALQAADPRYAGAAWIIGRPASKGDPQVYGLSALAGPSAARQILDDLAELHAAGACAPLLFFPECSLAYTAALLRAAGDPAAPTKALAAAARQWRSFDGAGVERGESTEPHVARVFGDEAPFVAGGAPEVVPVADGMGFHDLALRVWRPLLAHLEK